MEIKRCPVCGSRGIIRSFTRGGYRAYVDCGAGGCLVGPTRTRDADAVAAWNHLAGYRAALEELAAYCGNSDNWHRPVEARAMIEVMIDNALGEASHE